jgi:hypothetical protein
MLFQAVIFVQAYLDQNFTHMGKGLLRVNKQADFYVVVWNFLRMVRCLAADLGVSSFGLDMERKRRPDMSKIQLLFTFFAAK